MIGEIAVVEFERVSIAFDDAVVLREVSFSVRAAHMTILLGASGAGKSVILKIILGLLKPDSGRILLDGRRLDSMSEDELRAVRPAIGMLFQEGALFDSMTVAENVGYGMAEDTGLTPGDVQRRVEEVLTHVGLGAYLERMPAELSGGERRRVALARAMAPRPRLLLLDEPVSGLDPITARVVDDQIIAARDLQHAAEVLVTHSVRDALYMATHQAVRTPDGPAVVPLDPYGGQPATFLMLRDGRIYFQGTAAELRASDDPYLKAFLSDGTAALMNRAPAVARTA